MDHAHLRIPDLGSPVIRHFDSSLEVPTHETSVRVQSIPAAVTGAQVCVTGSGYVLLLLGSSSTKSSVLC